MTHLIQAIETTRSTAESGLQALQGRLSPRSLRALALVVILGGLLSLPGMAEALTAVAIDAYLEIAVFVAATLALIAVAETAFKTDLGRVLERHRNWQVPLAALLGAIPGCGGAIIAVTQFTKGRMSFGGFVAALIATGGDPLFLLIAKEPVTAGLVIGVSVAVAIPFGMALDRLHGPGFLRPQARAALADLVPGFDTQRTAKARPQDYAWLALMAPAALLAIPAAFIDLDLEATFGPIVLYMALAGVALGLMIWVMDGEGCQACEPERGVCEEPARLTRITGTTSFVLAWALLAMALFETLVVVGGLSVEALLEGAIAWVPLMAILVGFIPGCGPQIIVTSLYLAGQLPLAAQLGNAIANDGDALFPAISLAPKAAVAATLYSAVPAVVVAYGAFWLF